MARTNIEEEAHRRIMKCAQLMNVPDRVALGTVGYLWTDSQDILQTQGTREQILEWSHLFNISDEESDQWISALEKSRFISCLENGQYLIHGNETQIEGRVRFTARAAKGGNALKKKWNEKKKLKADLSKASRKLKAGLKQATSSPMQCNSMQGNSMQGNSIPVSSKQTKAGAFIVRYKSLFFDRWKVKVNVEGKDAGIAKRVAERLTYDEMFTFLDAFFSMPDAELVKKKHAVYLLEAKINEITVFAQIGKFTTQREANQADGAMALADQLKRFGADQ